MLRAKMLLENAFNLRSELMQADQMNYSHEQVQAIRIKFPNYSI